MTHHRPTLAEFLLARIAEDEASAGDACFCGWCDDPTEDFGFKGPNTRCGARIIAECEAKRRIVEGANGPERHQHDPYEWDYAFEFVLPLLALPYAEHPDYNPEWVL